MQQNKLKKLLVILFLFCLSCGKGVQLTAPEWTKNPPPQKGKLRFDGYYTVKDAPDDYINLYPVLFTKKNKTYLRSGGSSLKYPVNDCKVFASVREAKLGSYYIEGNKIIAYIPIEVSMKNGSWQSEYFLNFTGTIVDENTIIDWVAVPPFPSKVRRTEMKDDINRYIFNKHILKFKHSEDVKCLKTE